MEEASKNRVRTRADSRCEYCKVYQDCYPDFTFHIEHIIARQHGGDSSPDNLALSCHLCNAKKGPNLAGLDPDTGELKPLFHPRKESWSGRFAMQEDGVLYGLTSIGRTTVCVLGMNSIMRVAIRHELRQLGRWS